ncbi:MAG: acyltransferase [Gammaproteobacteria bacterium]
MSEGFHAVDLRGHIPQLDGVRGAAIILVLLHHIARSLEHEFRLDSDLLELMQFGWCGVDLFFVLSGFLITGILYESKLKSQYLRNFYVRRVLRIFPLYFMALAVVQLLRHTWSQPNLFGYGDPIWMWTYLTNVYIAVQGFGAFGMVDHFWSLAVEEHFYLVWPFAVLIGNRRQLMALATAIILIALSSRIIIALYQGPAQILEAKSAMLYVLTPLRMDSLALGGLIALAARGEGGIKWLIPLARMALVAALVVLSLVVLIARGLDHDHPLVQTIGLSVLALGFGAVLVLSIGAAFLARVFAHGALRWFGKYSYGMYVWHPIIFILVWHSDVGRALRGGNSALHIVASTATALSITLVVTLLSFHLWEKRFLTLKRYFDSPSAGPTPEVERTTVTEAQQITPCTDAAAPAVGQTAALEVVQGTVPTEAGGTMTAAQGR